MAKPNFKQLFADRTKYSDDIKFTLGDAEVTLGDLRAYDSEVGGELQKQLKDLEARESKLQAASENVAKMWIDIEAQRKQLDGTNKGTPGNDDPLAKYSKDEVFGPVVGYMRNVEEGYKKQLGDLSGKLDSLTKSIAQMGATYMGDRASQDFSAIPEDDPVRPKDLTMDKLYKFAVENRIYDRNNLPDMKDAYKRLTSDARHAYELEQARAEERRKVQEELAEGAMLPRPMSGLPALPEGMKPAANLQEAFSKAATDRDMWKQVLSTTSLM